MFTHLNNYTKSGLFYGLAIGLAVIVALLGPVLGQNGTGGIYMLTPLAAVLLMLLAVTNDGYGKAGWQALGLQRAGLRSWGLAFFGPLLILGVTYSIVWSTGIGRLVWPAEQSLVGFVISLFINIVIHMLFSLGEEIGYRGYLLPRLLPMGRTRALLLSGFLHAVWHLPIILLTPYYHHDGNYWIVIPLFLLTLTAAGVFYGYLRLSSASIWPATLAHSAFNTLWDRFTMLTVAVGSPLLLEYLAGESGILTLIGATVMAACLLWRLNRQPSPEHAQTTAANEALRPV